MMKQFGYALLVLCMARGGANLIRNPIEGPSSYKVITQSEIHNTIGCQIVLSADLLSVYLTEGDQLELIIATHSTILKAVATPIFATFQSFRPSNNLRKDTQSEAYNHLEEHLLQRKQKTVTVYGTLVNPFTIEMHALTYDHSTYPLLQHVILRHENSN